MNEKSRCIARCIRVVTVVTLLGLLRAAPAHAIALSEGRYEGYWQNQTFNTSGDASFDVAISGSTITVTIDLDGSVFGGTDPDPFILPGTISGDDISFSLTNDPLFGDLTASINAAGDVNANAVFDQPFFLSSAEMSGTVNVNADYLNLSYVLNVSGSSDQYFGFVNATLVPEPAGAALLLAGALSLIAQRRRD